MNLLLSLALVALILFPLVSSDDDKQHVPKLSWNNHSTMFNLDSKFPLTSEEDIIRGLTPHGYRGNVKKLHAILKKAILKKSLNIIVLGGSVPFGAGLEPNHARFCWPSQLMRMLQKIYNIKVSVNNLSIRAVSSDSQATGRFKYIKSHLKKGLDLILVDISLNDKPHHDPEFREYVAYFEGEGGLSAAAKEASLVKERKKQGEGRLLMQLLMHFAPVTTGIMYLETFAGGGKTSPVIHSHQDLLNAQKEGLTDGVYDFEERAIVFDCYPDVGRYYHFQALVEYKIPVLSYPDVVCPISRSNNSYWGAVMHHSREYHHFTAYIIALSIAKLSESDISNTSVDEALPFPVTRIHEWNDYIYDPSSDTKLSLDSKYVVCIITPLSYMAVNRPARFVPGRRDGGWKYYMDVADKPGWIADALNPLQATHAPRDIVFPITLSTEQPMLRLSYLRSYNKSMGTLSCCISESSSRLHCPAQASRYVFDGHWSDLTSQGVASAVHLSNIKGTAATVQRNVVCTADSGKFKIIGVVGC